MNTRRWLFASTIVITALLSLPSMAQPDFGYYSRNGDDDRYWVTGVADHLTEADKNRYKKVRSEINRYRFNGMRKTLASLLDHVHKHPDSHCTDNYVGGQTSYLKCEYGTPRKSKSFAGIMTYDVDGVLDKNVETPEETYAEERRQIEERRRNELKSIDAKAKNGSGGSGPTKVNTIDGYTATSGKSQSGNGVYRLPSSKPSSYRSYISNYIAPGSRSSRQPDMLVFSNGDAPVLEAPPSDGSELSYTPSVSSEENQDSD